MATFTALYDACVLYPAPLRDLLMELSGTGLFRARWTDAIHNEWIEGILRNEPHRERAKLERTRDRMNAVVLDCLVTGYELLIPALTRPGPPGGQRSSHRVFDSAARRPAVDFTGHQPPRPRPA